MRVNKFGRNRDSEPNWTSIEQMRRRWSSGESKRRTITTTIKTSLIFSFWIPIDGPHGTGGSGALPEKLFIGMQGWVLCIVSAITCLLLCNELLLALSQAKELVASDRGHRQKFCKNEYWHRQYQAWTPWDYQWGNWRALDYHPIVLLGWWFPVNVEVHCGVLRCLSYLVSTKS